MSYVLVPVEKANSSLEARQYVLDELSDDPSFVSEGMRFSSPICDWFVIGGRWSGELYPKKLRDEFWKQLAELNEEDDDSFGVSYSFIQEHRNELDSIWSKLGGKYNSPLTRDQYQDLGEEDDAIILESWLATELSVFLHDTDKYDAEGCYIRRTGWGVTPILISLDYDLLYDLKDFKKVVGDYWVVVIDYHC